MPENILAKGKPDNTKNRYFDYEVFVPKKSQISDTKTSWSWW